MKTRGRRSKPRELDLWEKLGVVLFCLLIAVLVRGFVPISHGQEQPAGKAKRSWSISLSKLPDWGRFVEKVSKDGLTAEWDYGRPQVEFINKDLLAVGFLYSPSGPTRHFMDPLSYKVFFLDAESGSLLKTTEWEARQDDANLLPTHDGGFVLRAGDKLMRFGAELELIAERPLPETRLVPPSTGTAWVPYLGVYSQVEMTAGGRVLLVRHINHPQQKNENKWVDADTLREVRSMTDEGRHPLVASERACATFRPGPRPRDEGSAFLWEPERGWRELATGFTPKVFLNNDKLLLVASPEFRVATLEGKTVYEGKTDEYLGGNLVVKVSMNMNRFVVLDSKDAAFLRGPFDRKFYAKVYESEKGALVAAIGLGTHEQGKVDLALSPDGSRLAILTASRLDIYKLPQR